MMAAISRVLQQLPVCVVQYGVTERAAATWASSPTGSGIGSSLFGQWKETFNLGATVIGVDAGMGAGRGRGRGGGGDASLNTAMDVGGIVSGNGRGVRWRSSPLSISVFTIADSRWSLTP